MMLFKSTHITNPEFQRSWDGPTRRHHRVFCELLKKEKRHIYTIINRFSAVQTEIEREIDESAL
jgi:hypothetical protein